MVSNSDTVVDFHLNKHRHFCTKKLLCIDRYAAGVAVLPSLMDIFKCSISIFSFRVIATHFHASSPFHPSSKTATIRCHRHTRAYIYGIRMLLCIFIELVAMDSVDKTDIFGEYK